MKLKFSWTGAAVASVLALLAMTGCAGPKEKGKVTVAVTTAPQAWLAERIVGDRGEVVALVPQGADAESFEPSVSTMKKLAQADVWMQMNVAGFESDLGKRISSNYPKLQLADVSTGIKRLGGHVCSNHGHDHAGHTEGVPEDSDPHLLASVRNAAIMASNMTELLSYRYPDDRSYFQARNRELQTELRCFDDSLRRLFACEGDRTFLIMHPSLGYFANDYGLTQIPLRRGGKEPSPRGVARRLEEARQEGTTLYVDLNEHPSPGARSMAEQEGMHTVEVSLSGRSILDPLRRMASALR